MRSYLLLIFVIFSLVEAGVVGPALTIKDKANFTSNLNSHANLTHTELQLKVWILEQQVYSAITLVYATWSRLGMEYQIKGEVDTIYQIDRFTADKLRKLDNLEWTPVPGVLTWIFIIVGCIICGWLAWIIKIDQPELLTIDKRLNAIEQGFSRVLDRHTISIEELEIRLKSIEDRVDFMRTVKHT